MQAYGYMDSILYFVFTIGFMIYEYGIVHFIRLSLTHLWIWYHVIYEYLSERYFLPFPLQGKVCQRATGWEFIISRLLKHNFNQFNSKEVKAILHGTVFRLLHRIRYLREFGHGLGDIIHKEVQIPVRGSWLLSKSRGEEYDLVIIYIHGSWILGGTIDLYIEYLMLWVVTLQEQGFSNPAIFAPEITNNKTQSGSLITTFENLSKTNRHIVITGDSIGATLAMSLQLDIQNRIEKRFFNSKPSILLLISPITQFEFNDTDLTKPTNDYIDLRLIKKWGFKIVPGLFPGQVDTMIWERALPEYGTIISYGSEESIVKYTEEFILKLQSINDCKLKIDRQQSQVHNWAILNFYSERLIEHREESLQSYSATISRLLLANTKSYFSNSSSGPATIVTIDEERV